MTFLAPGMLWLLLLVPLWGVVRWRRAVKHGLQLSDFRVYNSQGPEMQKRVWYLGVMAVFPEILRGGVFALLIVAMARPAMKQEEERTPREGIDIMLVVDTSDSMQALDFEINGERKDRLKVAVSVMETFVRDRVDDRIGLVVFGRTAFLQCPLTSDHGRLNEFLARVRPGIADGRGTAIGDALGVAVKRLQKAPSASHVAILLTDGSNNAGRLPPETATALAKEFGVRVYTVGVGSKGEAPVPVDTPFGKRLVYQKVDVDEELLQKIAAETGGKFFRATDTEELKEVYAVIDKLEKSRQEEPLPPLRKENFGGWIWAALLLLTLEGTLLVSPFRRLPQ